MKHLYNVADLHLGNHQTHSGTLLAGINDRCRHILDALGRVVDVVEADPDGVLVIEGDAFDKVRPNPPVLAAAQALFDRVPTIVIKGNHEANSDEFGDHALGPLRPVATVVETDTVFNLDGVALWCIPFRRAPAPEWIADAFAACAAQDPNPPGHPRVVGVHLGIADKKTAKFLQGKPDSIAADVIADLCFKHNVDHVYAGNWHDQRRWEFFNTATSTPVIIDQVGALVPTGWNNEGLTGYGGLGIYGRKPKPELLQLDGPRFVKALTDDDIDELLKLDDATRSRVYLRAYTEPDRVSSLSDQLHGAGFKIVEVHAHAVYRQAAAKQAATRAASADNVDDAIDGYVMRAPLPKGMEFVDDEDETEYREGVLQMTRDLLVEALTGVEA